MTGVAALTILWNVAAVCRLTRLSPRAPLAALRPSLLAGAGMTAALLAWLRLAPAGKGPLALAAAVALGAAVYLLLLRLLEPGLFGEARRALSRRNVAPEARAR